MSTVTTDPAITGAGGSTRNRPVRNALTHGQGLVGVLLVATIAVLGLAAPLLSPFDPLEQIRGANLLGPSTTHWFGTDEVNRDVFTRALYGIRVNLVIVFASVFVGAVVGTLVGLVSSVHPVADAVAQRLFDVILAFPALILAIALAAVVGPGALTVGIVVVAAEIPIFGRLVRAAVLEIRELPYVEAARVIGAGRWWILRTHILPNALDTLAVQIALSLSIAVFIEGAMSFIGIGVRAPQPSLGAIISGSVQNLDANPMYAFGPLLLVSGLVLGFLLIAQALGRARR